MNIEELKVPTTDKEAKELENVVLTASKMLGIYYDQKEREFKESLYDLPTFGARLRALREYHEMTKTDLAARSGVSVDSILRYEKGDTVPRYLLTLIAFANCFNVKVDLLLGIRPGRRGNE